MFTIKRYKYTKEGMIEDKDGEWIKYKEPIKDPFIKYKEPIKDPFEVPYAEMMQGLFKNGARIYRGE